MASIPAQVLALLHDIQIIRLGNVAGISLVSYDIREWAESPECLTSVSDMTKILVLTFSREVRPLCNTTITGIPLEAVDIPIIRWS